MKITLFIGGLGTGGAERVASNLSNYLADHGHVVEIMTMAEVKHSYYIEPKVSVYNLIKITERKNIVLDNILRFIRFCKYILNHKPDVYVVMLPFTITFMLSFRFLTKTKIVAAERANPSSYPTKIQNKLQKLAKKADGWVFQTEEQKYWYSLYLTHQKTTVIPNAINSDFIKPKQLGLRGKVIVTSGRLTAQKNHRLLITAFSRVIEKYPDYELYIYGEGPQRQDLEQYVAELNLQKHVFMPGYSHNICEKLRTASMFVLSSDFEGMPNALMEAMALGLPCISTDCSGGGARYLIDNEKNGMLIPQGDLDAMVKAMDKILSDEIFANRIASEAYKICDKLAPEKIYGKWEQFLSNISK